MAADCCKGMAGLFDRAADWRRRAQELRMTADGMGSRAARASLLDMAAALEHHAANLEQVIRKFRRIREAAADTRPLQSYIRRYPGQRKEPGD